MDADGCIRWDKSTPQVTVVSVFPGVLKIYKQTFGGSIYSAKKKGGTRAVWRWQATGDSAMKAITHLRPYLFEKRPQADLVIEIRKLKPGLARDGLVSQLKAMKTLDYPYTPEEK